GTMRARLAIGLVMVFAAAAAGAVESTTWPPPPETLAHMRELQSKIADPASSKDERAAAKKELERLMKARGAPEGKAAEAKKPARAAIEPAPPIGSAFEY